MKPTWLPEMANTDGDWEDVSRRLYAIFDRDLRRTGCALEGRQVIWNTRVEKDSPYEEGFWHLVTKDDEVTGDRLFDPRRAERLPWCKPTIVNSNDSIVKTWDYEEPRKRSKGKKARKHINTYVWLEEWNYVVILEKRRELGRDVAFLVTAYYVGNSTKRKLEGKYGRRIAE